MKIINKLKLVLLVILAASFLIGAFSALAQENLPDPGMLPDNPFYFFKSWKESIQTFFTFGEENKVKQFLHLAEVRLAEYQKIIEKGKTEIAEKTFEKYEKQLDRAVEKAQELQKNGKAENLLDKIAEKTKQHQEFLSGAFEKAADDAKKTIIENRGKKWEEFIAELRKAFPDLISGSADGQAMPLKLLIGCSIPAIPDPKSCERGWFLNQIDGCPYFSCPSVSKKSVPRSSIPIPPANSEKVCAQVITRAINPETKSCKEFPTPCDVPAGWSKIDKCPPVSTPSTSSVPSASSTSSTSPKPFISSEPTEIRYYTCPDGARVESGKCYGVGEKLTCSIVSSPELKCSAPTPPVSKGGVCATAGETKYYQCSDGTKATWCICSPESGAVGAKNVWRCQHLPQLACPKPTPAPVSQPVACYIQKDCFFVESKEDCFKKGGSPSSESSCPAPAPAPVPLACAVSGIKDYKCPDGTSIKWQCSCGEDSWSCQTNPAIFCPGLRDTTSLIISDIWIRDMFWTEETPVPNVTQGPGIFHIFWGTNKPATSYAEYGLTDSYGLTTPTPPTSLGIQHTNNGQTELKGNTLYHSRIVATDTQGNTAVSGDFTFFPAFNFTTIPGTVQPYIRLLGPGISPTHWKIGETPSIVWEARGVNKVNIDLVMFDGIGNRLKTYSIAKGVSSSGTAGGSYIYAWKVPFNSEFLQAGYKFKVVISDPVAFVFGTNANDLFIQK